MYNPEMILSNLWSFAEYQGKKVNDPFYMILFKRQVYPSLYTEYLTGRENTGSAVQTSRWRMLRKPYQVCF